MERGESTMKTPIQDQTVRRRIRIVVTMAVGAMTVAIMLCLPLRLADAPQLEGQPSGPGILSTIVGALGLVGFVIFVVLSVWWVLARRIFRRRS